MNPERIIDTDIISYLMKNVWAARVYAHHLEGRLIGVSFISVGELYFGSEKGSWGPKRRATLERTLQKFVVIPYDREVARCYGRLVAERQRSGRPIASNDAWIAACAVRHTVPLVTHNAKHFEGITELQVITESIREEPSQVNGGGSPGEHA